MSDTSMDGAYDVVWPGGRRLVADAPLAPRLDTLAGATVGFLWDYLFRGEEIFRVLADGLRQRFPDMRFVDYQTFGSTHGGDEHAVLAALPEKLRRHGIDAVISGMAC